MNDYLNYYYFINKLGRNFNWIYLYTKIHRLFFSMCIRVYILFMSTIYYEKLEKYVCLYFIHI